MKLIIAEKPNQAKEYAKALGNFSLKDGYLEGKEFIITWCFGHLIELEHDKVYRPDGSWSKSYLPLIPNKFLYKIGSDNKGNIDKGKKKQLETIRNLAFKCNEIINATDADREGELIFLYVYDFLKINLPYKRLWISSLTEGDIRKGFKNLLSPKDVENLGKSAKARAIADWLVGVNGTQASTLHFGKGILLTIGRVQTAILKIICERYLKNKNFKPTFTYKIFTEHNLNVQFSSATEPFQTKEEAEKLIASLEKKHYCKEVIKSKHKKNPPLLFSIDTLIIEANKKFSFTGKETLDIAQSLYEKKLTSYPRTDNEYINQENFNNLKSFLSHFSEKLLDKNFSFSNKTPKSVNDKKLTGSHDAIVPTGEFPELNKLNDGEKKIFSLILRRCLQSFSEDAIYDKTKIIFVNRGIEFYTYASKLVDAGWKKFELKNENFESEDNGEEQSVEININEGDSVQVLSCGLKEIESKAPALYSEVNLTKDLTNIGKLLKEENPELIKNIEGKININELQIGTQATRPSIIERLKNLDFINLHKNKYIPTEKGLNYYEIFKDLEVSNVCTTALWELDLKNIADGTSDDIKFYQNINSFTKKIVEDIFSKNNNNISFKTKREVIGKCPKCKKGDIVEGKKAFGCTEWKLGCDFTIWKEILKKKISVTIVKQLIEKGESKKIDKFISKQGKEFSAILELDKNFKTVFRFEKK